VKIELCGFVFPWWNELIPASTSSAGMARESYAHGDGRNLETRPILRTDAFESASSTGCHVLVDIEFSWWIQRPSDRAPRPATRDSARPIADDDARSLNATQSIIVVSSSGWRFSSRRAASARRFVAGHLERRGRALAAAQVAIGHTDPRPGFASVKSTSKETARRSRH